MQRFMVVVPRCPPNNTFPGPYNHFSVTERKPRISAGLGWKQSTDLTLLAGAG